MYFRMHGWRVFGVDLKPAPACQEGVLADFEEKQVQELKAAPWVVDAVVHLGGASKMVDDFPDSYYIENNVNATKRLRELYPVTPLYLASTTAMYNEQKQIEHKHPYSRTKQEAEAYADVIFRMGTISGTNRNGAFCTVIDQMIHAATTNNVIVVAQGAKMRPLAGITYICMMYYRNVANGALAERAKKEGAKVIQHLYETCQPIEAVANCICSSMEELRAWRGEASRAIEMKALEVGEGNGVSSCPPDFQANPVYDIRLFRLVDECLERYEYFAKHSD